MAKFYLAVVQAVLLYGSDSWVITDRDWKRLQSFHNCAIRYMTGKHIRKKEEQWEYSDQIKLQKQCGLFSIEEYIEHRRGTLREYLNANRKELMEEAMATERHSRDVNKILWWNQRYKTRTDSGNGNFWFT